MPNSLSTQFSHFSTFLNSHFILSIPRALSTASSAFYVIEFCTDRKKLSNKKERVSKGREWVFLTEWPANSVDWILGGERWGGMTDRRPIHRRPILPKSHTSPVKSGRHRVNERRTALCPPIGGTIDARRLQTAEGPNQLGNTTTAPFVAHRRGGQGTAIPVAGGW